MNERQTTLAAVGVDRRRSYFYLAGGVVALAAVIAVTAIWAKLAAMLVAVALLAAGLNRLRNRNTRVIITNWRLYGQGDFTWLGRPRLAFSIPLSEIANLKVVSEGLLVGVYGESTPLVVEQLKAASIICETYRERRDAELLPGGETLIARRKPRRLASVVGAAGLVTLGLLAVFIPWTYMGQRYQVTRACDALSKAIAEETPGALDDLSIEYAASDPWFAATRLGSKRLDPDDTFAMKLRQGFLRQNYLDGRRVAPVLSCFSGLVDADRNRGELRAQLASYIAMKVGLGENSGSRPIYVSNDCDETISVAVYSNEPGGGWTTRGWFKIRAGAGADTVHAAGSFIYLYAVSKNHVWTAAKDDPLSIVRQVSRRAFAENPGTAVKLDGARQVPFLRLRPQAEGDKGVIRLVCPR